MFLSALALSAPFSSETVVSTGFRPILSATFFECNFSPNRRVDSWTAVFPWKNIRSYFAEEPLYFLLPISYCLQVPDKRYRFCYVWFLSIIAFDADDCMEVRKMRKKMGWTVYGILGFIFAPMGFLFLMIGFVVGRSGNARWDGKGDPAV